MIVSAPAVFIGGGVFECREHYRFAIDFSIGVWYIFIIKSEIYHIS